MDLIPFLTDPNSLKFDRVDFVTLAWKLGDNMERMTKSKNREIIEDFAREIEKRKTPGPKPVSAVINFRNEIRDGIERPVYWVPIELLRFRKDNGRIRAEVLSYERSHGLLDEKTEEAQTVIRKILKDNDTEKNDELRASILHERQREPAIITCDGFLINGNRRKMILDTMPDKNKSEFRMLKVVILPGKNDPGGPPTLIEIEEIENRYQQQSEGKAEYSKFNIALSIKRKVDLGMSLDEQLKDDPMFANLPDKEFNKQVDRFKEEYLLPLECIDRYLDHLDRPGLYNTIASGVGDKEGRWQAFLDYYNYVYKKLCDEKQRMKMGVNENEIGAIEDIAFKVIRKREFNNLSKVHQIIRDFPKWLGNSNSKKALLKLKDISIKLPKSECFDKDGKEYDERTKDRIWGDRHSTILHKQLNDAKNSFDHAKDQETPISLLESALKKLEHENMLPDRLNTADVPKAKSIAKKISDRAKEIEHELFDHEKNLKRFKDAYGKR